MAISKQSINSAKDFRRLLHLQTDLRQGLGPARNLLSIEHIPAIIDELFRIPIYKQAICTNSFPQSVAKLKRQPALQYSTPAAEFVWSAAILKNYKPELDEFAQIKREFDHTYLAGKYDESMFWLDETQRLFGYSLWLIDNRLQVIQKQSGLAAQKEYLENLLQEDGISGTTAHLCFQFSFASEDNISLHDINRFYVQTSNKVLNNVRDYLIYHLNPFSISSINTPSHVLAIEESSSIIDRFNTFLDMLNLELIRSDEALPGYLQTAVELISVVADERLNAIKAEMAGRILREASEISNFLEPFDRYTLGYYAEAKNILVERLKNDAGAIELYELLARSIAQLGQNCSDLPLAPVFRVVQLQNAILGLQGDVDAIRYELERLAVQTRRQRCSRQIVTFLSRGYAFAITDRFSENEALLALGSFPANPWHQPILKAIFDNSEFFPQLLNDAPLSPSLALFDAMQDVDGDAASKITALKMPYARTSLYLGHAAARGGELALAVDHYREVLNSVNNFTALSAMRPLFDVLEKQGRHKEVFELIVESYFMNKGSYTVFPIEELIAEGRQANEVEEALLKAIVVEIGTRHVNSSFDADLSDAYEIYLGFAGVERPSELEILGHLWPQRVIHFLTYVCRIRTMEDSVEFETFDEVERERILILQKLKAACSEKADHFTAEISSITKEMEVAALFQQFEAGRLYVDEAGIVKSIASQFRDSFSRLRQLLLEPDLEYQTAGIAKRVKEILDKDEEGVHTIELPATQRDSLLRNIVDEFVDRFVLNVDYGFKTYLSSSIIHGHLEGELRSALRKNGLLFVMEESPAKLQIRKHWKSFLPGLTEGEWADLQEALHHFSTRLNKGILDLRDEKLRIRIDDKRNGLFTFNTTLGDRDRIRQDITPSTKLGAFFSLLFRHGWSLVESSLPAVEREIYAFGHMAENACNQMQASLEQSGLRDKASAVFDAIAHARTQLAIDIDRVVGWFRRTSDRSKETFSFSAAVHVALKVVNNCNPDRVLSPSMDIDIPNPQVLRGVALDPIIHVLVNCLQNAVSYSGLDRAPQMIIRAAVEGESLVIAVSNELSNQKDLSALRCAIDAKVAEVMNYDTSEIVSMEQGTGLHKIRRHLAKDIGADPSIECCVQNDSSFTIKISVRYEDVLAC